MRKLELIKCKDCQCDIMGVCFRFPPIPYFAVNIWLLKRPSIKYDPRGCCAGIPKKKETQNETLDQTKKKQENEE
ncbi:hypothetical protein LCGC14_3054560 [marine sediment metagenome]|uniref:Uncharacterized protein n=1 Tax=marine sediment metagenome TaxID=412755 RepID=A0A0F8ZBL3_9ZZZZ